MIFARFSSRYAMIAALVLSGCSTIPESGPTTNSIVSGALTTQNTVPSGKSVFEYALVDISKAIISYLTDPGAGSLQSSFGTGHGRSGQLKIGDGDVVQVTIFESGAGGLFIPSDAGARPGNYVTLPNETVDGYGYISVPYAGQIKAGGKTVSEIQDDIVKKLQNRALEPQVVVTQVSQSGNQITVVGEVRAPGKFPINTAGDRVLDALARAGGISHPGYETYVTLERHGKRATIWFDAMIRNPEENIFLDPDDTLYVYQLQRGFTAFGATGSSGQFKFDAPTIYLADAVGKAGGLLDGRADPGQVYLYRHEDRDALVKMGVDLSGFGPNMTKIPTIFRTNFRDPSSFFAAQKFPMRDQDVIFVSNADKVELEKFLGVITDISGTAGSVADNVYSVQSARILLRQ